jgi:hypothetical protein
MKKHYFLLTVLLTILSSTGSAATVDFFASYKNDGVTPKDAPSLVSGTPKNFSIAYSLGSNWIINSAKLWIKAVDDYKWGHCSGLSCKDGNHKGLDAAEYAKITELEGSSVNSGKTAINGYGWYDLNIDVSSFLLDGILNGKLAAVGDDYKKKCLAPDFWYKNAKLVIDYDLKEVPVPAAVWLFGSALLGLTGMKRKSPVKPAAV